MDPCYTLSVMFNQWWETVAQLILVRVCLMCLDVQERALDYLYQDLPDMHWYIEPVHDAIASLNVFKRIVEDRNTYLSWVLGVEAKWWNSFSF